MKFGMVSLNEPERCAPRIGVVVLAAGHSSRMGARNKLLEDLKGEPIVTHAVKQALGSTADGIVVVTGYEAQLVREALQGLGVTFVNNPEFAQGLSASLRAGLKGLMPGVDAAVICLGDMPQVEAIHIDRLIAAYAPKEGRAICVPVRHGRRGNPVLWGAKFFDAMMAVKGDAGARQLIGEYEDQVAEVDLDSDAIFVDVDTPEALWRLRELGRHD